MNKKVSGAKTVVVKLESTGKNYLPFVEYLKDRYIKFIDVVLMQSLPDSTDAATTTTDGLFLTLANTAGNSFFVHNEPLKRFDIAQNLGMRKPIAQKLSLQNSYIELTDSSLVGKSVVLVFWYDLPEYSSRNASDAQLTDNFEVQIVSNSSRNMLPDNRTMVGKRFRKLCVSYPTTTPTLASGITSAQASNLYFTMQKGNYRIFDALPLPELYEIGMLEGIDLANVIFDFTYSYVFVGGKGTLTGYEGKNIFVNAVYEDK